MEEEVKFSDQVVAYVDVLGQREKLNRLKKLPANEEDMKVFKETAFQTYIMVDSLRKGLLENSAVCYEVARRYIDNLPDTDEAERSQLRNQVEDKLHFSFFSDSIAVNSPYHGDDGKPLIQHVFTLMVNLSAMMITSMSRHTPIRGAVEVGKGFEWPEGGVYGPIMADVYELESQIAYYPRIVIGQDLSSRICGWNKELQENNSYYVGYKELISTGKPPALPGDSKSLTDTGVVHQTRRL